MSSSETAWHAMYSRFQEVLGPEHVETLMGELATKSDIRRLDSRLEDMGSRVDQRFEQVDKRFEQVDKRFEQVDKRFEQVDKRLERVENRIERVDARLERIEEGLTGVAQAINSHNRGNLIVLASAMVGLTGIFGIMLAAFG